MSLPRIWAGRRRWILVRLVANGFGQAATALGVAVLIHELLQPRPAALPALLLLGAGGFVVAALRIQAAGLGERLGQHYVMRVRLRIFERLAQRPGRGGAPDRAGLSMTRLIGDLNSLRNWVSAGIARSAVAGVTIAGVLLALAWLHPSAAGWFAGMVLSCGIGAVALAPALRGRVREARRRRGRLAGNLGEKLIAFRTVQKLGRTDAELRRVRRHSEGLRDALVKRARAAEAVRALPDLATPLVLALWIGTMRSSNLSETAAGLLLLGTLTASLRDLTQGLDHRLSFAEGQRRISQLLEGPRLREKRQAQALPPGGPLGLELSKAAVDGILRGVTLRARPGERVLVSGAAGSGKSTLLALASRLLDPDAGAVLVDGVDLRDLSLDTLHEAVQLVSPELPLLRGSIVENVSYGAHEDDPEWIQQVAEACGLARKDAGEDLLSARVEERGANLANGLRARVTLARALAMRPRLLLVDDPAFSADEEAAAALRKALELHPTTALIAASDASEMLRFDRVWRLQGGRAVETSGIEAVAGALSSESEARSKPRRSR